MKPDFPVFSLDGASSDVETALWEYDKATQDVYAYAEKRDHVDSSKIAYTVVFEKDKNWQIVQDRHSGNTYLIVLKD
jgi:hypothetical protein